MSKGSKKRSQIKRRQKKWRLNPLILNMDSSQFKDPSRKQPAIGYRLFRNATSEDEAAIVAKLRAAYFQSIGVDDPKKPKKEKKVKKIVRYKIELTEIGNEL